MRISQLAAMALAAAALLIAASIPAAAGGREPGYVYPGPLPHPSSAHAYWDGLPDPYTYKYVPVGYYPYYDSDYWRPRAETRYRYRKPLLIGEYWSSWGYPVRCKDKACRYQTTYKRVSK
jgi:hypothetical protein